MPAEKFYTEGNLTGVPNLWVAWGNEPVPQVRINDQPYDRSGLNRLIRSLRKARDQVYGSDE